MKLEFMPTSKVDDRVYAFSLEFRKAVEGFSKGELFIWIIKFMFY